MPAIDDLIASAERIAHFGIQSGRITDTRLAAAIGAAETARAAGTLTAGGGEAVELAEAVQEAARMISPTSVAELSQGWNPFATPSPAGRRVAHWATLTCTVLLVVAAGYYTLWQKRATDLMTFVVDQAVGAQRDALLDVTLPLLARGSPDSDTPSGQTASDTEPLEAILLLQDIRKIQDMQRSIDLFEDRFNNLYQDRIILRGQLLDIRDWWSERGTQEQPVEAAPPHGAASASETPRSADDASEAGPVLTPAVAQAACAPVGPDAAGSDATAVVASYNRFSGCLVELMNVQPWSDAKLRDVYIDMYRFDHALNVLGSWILPAVYGALGALIYYMRQFLDPLRRDPQIERVIIRVSLGAFAGITVGWFFTPTTAAQGFGFPDVGMATLTFAFVLGFSIEVFFGFLERMVNLSNEGIARLGRPQG